MKTKHYPTVIVAISCCCFLLFTYAAANKLMDYQKFQVQIAQSPILTDYASTIAWIIPAIELIISLLLIFPRTNLLGLYCSFGLMLLFTLYIVIILNFADRIPCSCGGILEKMGWTEHLIFNISFTVLTIASIFLQSKIDEIKKFQAKESGIAENP